MVVDLVGSKFLHSLEEPLFGRQRRLTVRIKYKRVNMTSQRLKRMWLRESRLVLSIYEGDSGMD